jgi:hypothetical protein
LIGVRNFALFVKLSASFKKVRNFSTNFTFEAIFVQKLTLANLRCVIKSWQISCRYV